MSAKKIVVGIIGGSGFEDSPLFNGAKKTDIMTPYGKASALKRSIGNKIIIFLPRHGLKHNFAPHKINYRANIFALKKLGVTQIIATAAVGSLNKKLKPGHLAVLYDLIDFTKSRIQTFYDKDEVVHVDMTNPYDPHLSAILASSIKKVTGKMPGRAVYAASEGPRFETAAEIRMYAKCGAHVVGMTNSPEMVLARELGIPYATVSIVTNYGCGLTKVKVTADDVTKVMKKNKKILTRVFTETIKSI